MMICTSSRSKCGDLGLSVRTELTERDLLILIALSGLFGASIVLANISAGVKLIEFLGLVVPGGTVAYAITFPVTDIVDEVYGKRRAIYIVWAGLIAEIAMLALIGIDYVLPAYEEQQQVLYERVFAPQIRIVAASILAYIVSQHHDVWAFWKWREITGGKFLWIRNNASTTISQLIDTMLFTFIAFYGVVPLEIVVNMALSMWLFKVLIAVIDTPFVYLGVELVKKYAEIPIATPSSANVPQVPAQAKS
ncbi:MAG: VUT family protein [Thermoprotei archaeon]|nr:MAG: VUT family protein [Thermoprotei archaeon]